VPAITTTAVAFESGNKGGICLSEACVAYKEKQCVRLLPYDVSKRVSFAGLFNFTSSKCVSAWRAKKFRII